MNKKYIANSPDIGSGHLRRAFDLIAEQGTCLDDAVISAMNDLSPERVVAILGALQDLQLVEINDTMDRSVRTIRLTRQGAALARSYKDPLFARAFHRR
jgi:hypothetical protein